MEKLTKILLATSAVGALWVGSHYYTGMKNTDVTAQKEIRLKETPEGGYKQNILITDSADVGCAEIYVGKGLDPQLKVEISENAKVNEFRIEYNSIFK